jgi:hypothetical protein
MARAVHQVISPYAKAVPPLARSALDVGSLLTRVADALHFVKACHTIVHFTASRGAIAQKTPSMQASPSACFHLPCQIYTCNRLDCRRHQLFGATLNSMVQRWSSWSFSSSLSLSFWSYTGVRLHVGSERSSFHSGSACGSSAGHAALPGAQPRAAQPPCAAPGAAAVLCCSRPPVCAPGPPAGQCNHKRWVSCFLFLCLPYSGSWWCP